VAVHLEPFLPGSAARILEQFRVPEDVERPNRQRVRWGGLPPVTLRLCHHQYSPR
jgi:hypothetical protein